MPATSNVKQEAEDGVIFLGFAADGLVDGHNSKAQPLVADIKKEVWPRGARLIFEGVVVPTWKEVERRKRGISPVSLGGTNQPQDEVTKDVEKTLEKIKIPKVKVKAAIALSDETLFDRIRRINCSVHDIDIPQDIRDVAVTREFLSLLYGGNRQNTLPTIAKRFLDQHGLDDFMYPSLDYNPAAPQIPGAPGLYFQTSGPAWKWFRETQRVIIRIASGAWQYMGQYTLTPTASLTTREWAQQSELFRNTWSRDLCVKGWGEPVLRRIAARRRFNCTRPTREQLEIISDSGEHKRITAEDVKAAIARGEEEIGVWEMKCVGYDVEFQQNIVERFKTWVPPSRKPRNPRKGKESTVQPKARAGKKRKRSHSTDSPNESDSDVVILEDSDSD